MTRSNKTDLTPYYDTALHKILVDKLKDMPGMVVGGRICTKTMAEVAGVCRYTIYRWFQAEALNQKAAKRIIEFSQNTETEEPRVTKEDLLPLMGL